MTDVRIVKLDERIDEKVAEFSDSTALIIGYWTNRRNDTQGPPVAITCYNDFKQREVYFSIQQKTKTSFYVNIEMRTYNLLDRVPDWLVDDWLEKIRLALRAFKISDIEVGSRPTEPLR